MDLSVLRDVDHQVEIDYLSEVCNVPLRKGVVAIVGKES